MFETETVRPCLVQKLKWGEGAWPPDIRSGNTPAICGVSTTNELSLIILYNWCSKFSSCQATGLNQGELNRQLFS